MDLNRIIVRQTLKDTYIHPIDNGDNFETKDSKKIQDLVIKMLDNGKTLDFDEEVRGVGKTTLILKLAEITGYPIVVENSSCIAHRAKEENKVVHIFNTRELDKLNDFLNKYKELGGRVLVDEITHNSYDKLYIAGISPIGFIKYDKTYLSPFKIFDKIRSISYEIHRLANIPGNLVREINVMSEAVANAYREYEEARNELMMIPNERTKEQNMLLRKAYDNRKDEFDEAVKMFYVTKDRFDTLTDKINKAIEGDNK